MWVYAFYSLSPTKWRVASADNPDCDIDWVPDRGLFHSPPAQGHKMPFVRKTAELPPYRSQLQQDVSHIWYPEGLA